MVKKLPIKIKYKDKIEFANKLLTLYSELVYPLTKRNISLLTICLIEDINDDDFQQLVINSKIGINNEQHFRTEMHRLKEKSLILKDPIINRKNLSPEMKKLSELVKNEDTSAIYLIFDIIK